MSRSDYVLRCSCCGRELHISFFVCYRAHVYDCADNLCRECYRELYPEACEEEFCDA